MTNLELQELLKDYPPDTPVCFSAMVRFGEDFSGTKYFELPIKRVKLKEKTLHIMDW